MRVLVEQVPGADWAAAILQPAAADLPVYLELLTAEVDFFVLPPVGKPATCHNLESICAG